MFVNTSVCEGLEHSAHLVTQETAQASWDAHQKDEKHPGPGRNCGAAESILEPPTF